jgi:hypothetical protein
MAAQQFAPQHAGLKDARSYFFSNSPVRCRFTNVVFPAQPRTVTPLCNEQSADWQETAHIAA